MAIDESMLEAVRQGQSPPTLRLYTWKPACLSIGRFQRAARSVDWDALASLGYGFVRRPTGGRAVLHDDELTYAVIANVAGLAGAGSGSTGVLDTYLALSRGLAAGLARMGIPVELAPRDAGRAHRGCGRTGDSLSEARSGSRVGGSAACFDSPSAYELLAAGRKIVGSAQVRRGSTFLQHGSIPISMNFAAAEAAMGMPKGSGADLSRCVATVGEFIAGFPTEISSEEVIAQLAEAIITGLMSEVMEVARPGELTPVELELASQLRAKYQSEDWNLGKHRDSEHLARGFALP
ncbi:MAG: lipoate--protein ligase family protein [Firmicutes bacterium]|jgi:lipoate-protein ligase A|nr:lipoate--protein ligase family protein [Bacillota bacterium]